MGKYLKQGFVRKLERQLAREEISYSKMVELMEEECIKNYKAETTLGEKMNKLYTTAEELAEWFHDNYEEVSLKHGWKTQDNCQVPFIDLPENNKKTMIEVCQRLLNL